MVNPWPGTSASVGGADFDWLSGLTLSNVRIANPDSTLQIGLDTLAARFDLSGLARGRLTLHDVSLVRPVVVTSVSEDGRWLLLEPFGADSTAPDDTTAGLRIDAGRLTIRDGSFTLLRPGTPPMRAGRLLLSAHTLLIDGGVSGIVDSLRVTVETGPSPLDTIAMAASGSLAPTGLDLTHLDCRSSSSTVRGRGRIPFALPEGLPDISLSVVATPIAYRDIHPFVSGIGPEGSATVTIEAGQTDTGGRATGGIRFPGGGSIEFTLVSARRADGRVDLDIGGTTRNLSVAAFTGPPDTAEQLSTQFSLRGNGTTPEDFRGTVSVDSRASRFGGLAPIDASIAATMYDGNAEVNLRGNAGGLGLDAAGTVTPFAGRPGYDLKGTLRLAAAPGEPAGGFLERIGGMECSFTGRGEGFDPRAGHAAINARAVWKGNSRLRALTLDGTVRDGDAWLAGRLETAGGEARIRLTALIAEEPEIDLRELALRRFDLGVLLGDGASSSLSGFASGTVRGVDPSSLVGSLTVDLDTSRIGELEIRNLRTRLDANGGTFTLAGNAETEAGTFGAGLSADPFAPRPSATVKNLEFRGLDLQRLAGMDGFSTDLNGSMRLRGAADSREDLRLLLDPRPTPTPPGLRLEGDLTLDSSRINRQPIQSGTVTVSLARGTLVVDGTVSTPRGGVDVDGSARPFDAEPRLTVDALRFTHLDIASFLDSNAAATDLSGVFRADLRETDSGEAAGELSLDLVPSFFNDEPIERATVRGTMADGRIQLRGDVLMEDGTIEISGTGSYGDGLVTGSATGTVRLQDLARLLGDSSITSSGLGADFSAEGSWGDIGDTRFSARFFARGRVDSVQLDSLVCALSVLGRTIDIDTLTLSSNVAHISASGPLAIFDTSGTTTSDMTISGSLRSLKPIESVLPLRVEGAGSFSGRVTGSASATFAEGTVTLTDFGMNDISVGRFDATGSVNLGRGLSIASVKAGADIRGTFFGTTGIDHARIAVSSEGRLYSLRADIQPDDSSLVVAQARLDLQADSTVVIVDSLVIIDEINTWRLNQSATVSVARAVRVDDLLMTGNPGRLSVRGVLDPDGMQDFAVEADSIPFARLVRVFGRTRLGGTVSIRLGVTGPGAAATALGALTAEIESEGRPIGRMEANLDWRDSVIVGDALITQPDGARLEAAVSLPARLVLGPEDIPASKRGALFEQVKASLRTERFSLGMLEPFLNPATVRHLSGTLRSDVTLTGAADSMRGSGTLEVDSGSVSLISLGVDYRDITLRTSLVGPRAYVSEASLKSGSGSLRGEGVVDIGILTDPALALRLTAQDFLAVQTQSLKATVGGDVTISGSLDGPLIAGKLTVRESSYLIPESFGGSKVESVELTDADYVMLRNRLGYSRRAPRKSIEESSPAVGLDLTITMDRNTWIRKRSNPTLAVELEGDIALRSRPGEPFSVFGTLRPVPGRSYVSQFGRQFEISGGEIRFNGSPADVDLDIGSEYRVPSKSGSGLSEVVVTMRIQRALEKLTFHLTADPPMDESEILNYLATGTATTGALAGTGSQGNIGTSAAIEQVVGAVGSLTEGKIPLDIFQIRQDGARGVTIVAGNYVSPRTYLGVRQPIILNQSTQDYYDDIGTEFEVEYEAARWLFLNARGGGNRLLFLFKSRLAY